MCLSLSVFGVLWHRINAAAEGWFRVQNTEHTEAEAHGWQTIIPRNKLPHHHQNRRVVPGAPQMVLISASPNLSEKLLKIKNLAPGTLAAGTLADRMRYDWLEILAFCYYSYCTNTSILIDTFWNNFIYFLHANLQMQWPYRNKEGEIQFNSWSGMSKGAVPFE